MDKIKCACNGKKCDGICRETNLFRTRRDVDLKNQCPAAYGDEKALHYARK